MNQSEELIELRRYCRKQIEKMNQAMRDDWNKEHYHGYWDWEISAAYFPTRESVERLKLGDYEAMYHWGSGCSNLEYDLFALAGGYDKPFHNLDWEWGTQAGYNPDYANRDFYEYVCRKAKHGVKEAWSIIGNWFFYKDDHYFRAGQLGTPAFKETIARFYPQFEWDIPDRKKKAVEYWKQAIELGDDRSKLKIINAYLANPEVFSEETTRQFKKWVQELMDIHLYGLTSDIVEVFYPEVNWVPDIFHYHTPDLECEYYKGEWNVLGEHGRYHIINEWFEAFHKVHYSEIEEIYEAICLVSDHPEKAKRSYHFGSPETFGYSITISKKKKDYVDLHTAKRTAIGGYKRKNKQIPVDLMRQMLMKILEYRKS